ncbi:hypothetical protein NBRGN_016_00060 [Nocardia brasiliensis NBRC 14402]|nr:hypothetical protein [Nocardia brasiliensis]AVL26552.1 hypothetical protein CEQ30_41120 [Nocardia brasiliensis]GAJ79623.1 hypothetical protein NBRGN_016_00060 [Nocardia brasiliensis NBRC 14402]SUB53352.1 Uncharacterised protein [Nocardia brasiliensis]
MVPYGSAGIACAQASNVIAGPTIKNVVTGARRRHHTGTDARAESSTTHHGCRASTVGPTLAAVTTAVKPRSTAPTGNRSIIRRVVSSTATLTFLRTAISLGRARPAPPHPPDRSPPPPYG